MRLDRAAMQSQQTLNDRQADSQSTFRPIEQPIALHEEIEHSCFELVRQTDTAVMHAHDGLVAFAADAKPDMATVRSVLRGIVEDVLEYLCQPRQIGLDAQWPVGGCLIQDDLEGVLARVDQRSTRLDGTHDRRIELYQFLMQYDLAARDSAHVEQAVDQSGELSDLSVDHR